MKRRPIGITILAVLSLIAAVIAAIHTLQMLHLFPFFLGPVTFFSFDLFGALLWGIITVIYLWVFRMLWQVNPQGWLFLVIISALNLILAVMSLIGATALQELLPTIVVNGIILLYCLLPGTKAAFDLPSATS